MSATADWLVELVAGSRSLRIPDPARLRRLDPVRCVVVVGATCAGKTTLVEAVRASPAARSGRLEAPPRFLTRPARFGDRPTESVSVDPAGFEQRVRDGAIGLRWQRPMERGRVERYGFPWVPPGTLAVYSGNNALLANAASVEPVGALDGALFVGVFAPDEVRARRLAARSPDLCRDRPAEVTYRLADPAEGIRAHVHVVVENHGEAEVVAATEVVRLAEGLAGRR